VTILSQTVDRYRCTVVEVIGDVNLNLAMVEDRQAFAYRQYLRKCDEPASLWAERAAETARTGVWAVSGSITRPWEWRHSKPRRSSPTTATSGPSAKGTVKPPRPFRRLALLQGDRQFRQGPGASTPGAYLPRWEWGRCGLRSAAERDAVETRQLSHREPARGRRKRRSVTLVSSSTAAVTCRRRHDNAGSRFRVRWSKTAPLP
jgi:hypothetical protein